MGRGYIDFRRQYAFARSFAFFVIRAKSNLDYNQRGYQVQFRENSC